MRPPATKIPENLNLAANWVGVVVLFVAFAVVAVGGFLFLRGVTIPLWVTLFVSVGWSLTSCVLLYMFFQRLMDAVPPHVSRVLTPFLLVGPVVVLLTWTLLIPLVRTAFTSVVETDSSGTISGFAFLGNYVEVFTQSNGGEALRNNALWIIVGTPVALTLGMIVAVLADGRRMERFVKTIVFMPLAISLVGAGIVWGLVYQAEQVGDPQTGLLNAIVVGLGGTPQAWLQVTEPLNTLFLMVIAVWSGTGFSMVFFSAALRGVPQELIEAARVDGSGPFRIFFQIQLPYIWPTVLAIGTTSVINGLKIFDVIQTLTGGAFGTEVLATAFLRAEYQLNDSGRAAAIAMILLILIVPVIYYNLRQFRATEGVSPGGRSMFARLRARLSGKPNANSTAKEAEGATD